MSLIKQLIPQLSYKFTPASSDTDWQHINSLAYGNWTDKNAEDMNSAVFSCLMAIARSYPEPPLVVYKKRGDGNKKEQVESPCQKLLDSPTPNGELTLEDILFWTAWAKHVDGNAYWLKIRSGDKDTGNVVQLWPISPTLIQPISENKEWISYYKYFNEPGKWIPISVQNLIHFRLGVDDKDHRKGLAPLKALVRQIASDEETDKFVEALLKNYAIPGLVVIPPENMTIDKEKADEIEDRLHRKFSGEKRGNIAVMTRGGSVEQFGFSPDELNLQVLHRVPEERISAVLGVPAIVAGLGAGLDRATYDNGRALKEWFTESNLIPQWRSDGRRLTISLLPDFTSNPNFTIEFDLTNVRALQEDEDNKYKRLQLAVGKPWMTRNEAREDTNMDPIEGWDDEDKAEPEPVPQALKPFVEGEQNQEIPDELQKDFNKDLTKWRHQAIRLFKSGKNVGEKFESDIIPPSLIGAIEGALEKAESLLDINRIFSNIRNWKSYP